jgi:hypothetical protein
MDQVEALQIARRIEAMYSPGSRSRPSIPCGVRATDGRDAYVCDPDRGRISSSAIHFRQRSPDSEGASDAQALVILSSVFLLVAATPKKPAASRTDWKNVEQAISLMVV